jgi:ribulose-phosphate 3-epimerase
MNILSPSILAMDFNNMGETLKLISETEAEYLHVDVMDGMFVPNISFGPPVIQCVKKASNRRLDVHLMIEEPARYISEFQACGADILTVHAESCKHLHSTVMAIQAAGMKAGVALNPATPVSVLEYIIQDVDMVLVMSVNPGFGGQKFIPSALDKLREVKALAEAKGVQPDIEVDGGVTLDNVQEVLAAGANVIVAGSAVFKGDIKENINRFMELLRKDA